MERELEQMEEEGRWILHLSLLYKWVQWYHCNWCIRRVLEASTAGCISRGSWTDKKPHCTYRYCEETVRETSKQRVEGIKSDWLKLVGFNKVQSVSKSTHLWTVSMIEIGLGNIRSRKIGLNRHWALITRPTDFIIGKTEMNQATDSIKYNSAVHCSLLG